MYRQVALKLAAEKRVGRKSTERRHVIARRQRARLNRLDRKQLVFTLHKYQWEIRILPNTSHTRHIAAQTRGAAHRTRLTRTLAAHAFSALFFSFDMQIFCKKFACRLFDFSHCFCFCFFAIFFSSANSRNEHSQDSFRFVNFKFKCQYPIILYHLICLFHHHWYCRRCFHRHHHCRLHRPMAEELLLQVI